MAYTEENNYPKALALSTMAMAILLVISYFVIIGTPFTPQEVGTGGIIVNYGSSAEGVGDDYLSVEEPSVSPDANGVVPDNVSKTPNTTATT
ncbi:MAG: energy transducer TonB, partial [Sphingobacteriaceae bacterium]|nr:energy transducer TonB [Sphingobacteriaceae bacterium]